MRRADRLFEIVQLMRGRRFTTARWLADKLEISERTVYRDIADLMASGVPIDGEAGVGYRLHRSFELPPLMFSRAEIEALVIGARIVRSWGGPALAESARQALVKIEAVLPEPRRHEIAQSRMFAEGTIPADTARTLDLLRAAVNESRVVQFRYTREDGEASTRMARPLALFFWGRVWTLAAWCELREDFRNFRVDRMLEITLLQRRFEEQPGTTLEDYLRITCADAGFTAMERKRS